MKLLAVDSNSILNRAYYGVRPLTTHDGRFTNGIFGFLSILLKLLDEVGPDALAFAFDLRAPTFRHKRYDGYKATRKGMPDELAQQVEPLKAIIRAMGYRIVEVEGYEADDVLGTLASLCEESGDECVIATGDRDSFQLVSERVTVRLASTKGGQSVAEMIGVDEIKERYGLSPRQMIDVKALMGDTSDNIPGIPGIGEKTALLLIQKFSSLDGVYENLDDPIIKPAIRRKLINYREKADLSYELAEICRSVPLGVTLSELTPKERDDAALYRLFDSLELLRMIARFHLTAPQEEAPAPQESHAPAAAPVTCSYNEPETFLSLLSEENLCLALGEERKNRCAALLGSSLALLDGDCPQYDELLAAAEKHNPKLTLCNAKDWYRRTLSAGKEPALVRFDPSLAGYLIAPTASSYTVSALALGREVSPVPAAFSGTGEDLLGQTAKEALLLPSLQKTLEKELDDTKMKDLLTGIEQPLARVLASMEEIGFSVDAEGLTRYGLDLREDIRDVLDRIYFYTGELFNVNSPRQLAIVLYDKLQLKSKNGKKVKGSYSTNAETLEKMRSQHPVVDEVLDYRKLSKLKSTYVDGLLAAIGPDGRVHSRFKQTETRTGRISSAEPNLQNIPVRTERGSRLRAFFTAKPGCVLVDADYSQIELRLLAHLSGDEAMIRAFRENADIHTQTAAQVFDVPEEFVTPQMRSAAKAVNFGLVYGIGAYSLSQDIGVSVAEADRYIKAYFATYSGVERYMEETVKKAKEQGYVETMFGRRRPLPELTSQYHATRAFGERAARNTPIQGTAADVIKLAMVRVYDRLEKENLRAKLILQVHDELIVEAPEEEAERVRALLTEEMEHAVTLSVPLVAEAKIGKNWLEAKG